MKPLSVQDAEDIAYMMREYYLTPIDELLDGEVNRCEIYTASNGMEAGIQLQGDLYHIWLDGEDSVTYNCDTLLANVVTRYTDEGAKERGEQEYLLELDVYTSTANGRVNTGFASFLLSTDNRRGRRL